MSERRKTFDYNPKGQHFNEISEKSKVSLPQVSPKSKGQSVFSSCQISKYSKWFHGLSRNKIGTVALNELAVLFISTGLSRNKKVFDELFEPFENSSSVTGEVGMINFNNFLCGIEANVLSRKLSLNALDIFVGDDDSLSTDTILSQERRKLLMQHVVDRPAVRAWGIDNSSDVESTRNLRQRHRRMKSLSELSKAYDQERADTTEIVQQLKDILIREKEKNVMISTPPPVKKAPPVLEPLESLLSENLLEYVSSTNPDLLDSTGKVTTPTSTKAKLSSARGSGSGDGGSDSPFFPDISPGGTASSSSSSKSLISPKPRLQSIPSITSVDDEDEDEVDHVLPVERGAEVSHRTADKGKCLLRSRSAVSFESQSLADIPQQWIMKKTYAISATSTAATPRKNADRMISRGDNSEAVLSKQELLDPIDSCGGESSSISSKRDLPAPKSGGRPTFRRWNTYNF